MDKYKLPEGLKDYLPKDCYSKSVIENKIMRVFSSHNYLKVETPTLEYYSLYCQGVGSVSEEKLFKLTDTDGRLLILRPDITLPISRVVSTKIKPKGPEKYSYLGRSYTLCQDSKYRLREFTQAGVELINEPSVYGDVEMIAMAIEALTITGLENFLIDIGQVAFFNGIIESFDISEADKKSIAEHVYKKDIIGLQDLIDKNNNLNGESINLSGVDREQLKILIKLPSLFGGIEVLDEAEKFELNDKSLDALDNLRQIYDLLESRGLAKYVSFDLSLVNSMNYYSGIVFRGMTQSFGAPILAGGRYDGLSSAFRANLPSTGFAIGVDNILTALERSGKSIEEFKTDYVIGYDLIGYDSAVKVSDNLRKEGFIVDMVLVANKEEMVEYQKGKETKCDKLIFIGDKEKGSDK